MQDARPMRSAVHLPGQLRDDRRAAATLGPGCGRGRTGMKKAIVLAATAGLAACTTQGGMKRAGNHPDGMDRIDNIVVIYAENRSFDNLYGSFPGANGLENATAE